MYDIDRIRVVKIGGNVIDDPDALADFLEKFSRLAGPKVLVHGGGKEATRVASGLGIEAVMIDGRRVTDAAMLDVCTMVYAGQINKRIVAAMQARGMDAIGLTGADGNAVTAVRRHPIPIDYGFVGDIDPLDVNDRFLIRLLNAGMVPVMCAIMHDGNGQLLNCNADSVASAVAMGLSRQVATDLIFCFEKPGVLAEVDRDDSLIRTIDGDSYETLRASGVISKGMIPKLENAMTALRGGVSAVIIKSASNLLEAEGTVITL